MQNRPGSQQLHYLGSSGKLGTFPAMQKDNLNCIAAEKEVFRNIKAQHS
jgi:hypothetical protein